MDCFGELLYSFGYREKLVGLYGFGLGGSPYPAQALPMWQKFFHRMKKQVFGFMLRKSEPMLAIFTQPSSVTKRNIMDGMCKVRDMAYTPHQCSYSDRKGFPLGENHPYGPEGLLECPWSEILPSVTLTKRYDLIWNSGGGVQTPHGTRIWCEKSFNGSKSGFFHFCQLFWHNDTLILVYKSMSNANLELWPHMESPRWL